MYIAKFQIYTPIYSLVRSFVRLFSYAFSFSFRFPILEVFRMRLAAHAWRIHGKVRRRYSTDPFFSSIFFDFAEFSSRSPLPFHPLPFPIRRDFAPLIFLTLCIFRLFVDFCIPCLSFQIYSSAIHKYGGWAFFSFCLHGLFQLDLYDT